MQGNVHIVSIFLFLLLLLSGALLCGDLRQGPATGPASRSAAGGAGGGGRPGVATAAPPAGVVAVAVVSVVAALRCTGDAQCAGERTSDPEQPAEPPPSLYYGSARSVEREASLRPLHEFRGEWVTGTAKTVVLLHEGCLSAPGPVETLPHGIEWDPRWTGWGALMAASPHTGLYYVEWCEGQVQWLGADELAAALGGEGDFAFWPEAKGRCGPPTIQELHASLGVGM